MIEGRYDVPSANGNITHLIGSKISILYLTDQGRIGMCSDVLDPIPSISYAGGVSTYSFSPLKQDEKKAFALVCTAGDNDRDLLALVKVGGKDVLIVDLATHARQTLKGSKSVISSICSHPFASIVATLSVEGELRLWDIEDGTLLSAIETGLHSQQGQSFLTFGRDGTALVVGVQGEELLVFSSLGKDGKMDDGSLQAQSLTLSLVARQEHEAVFVCASALPPLLLTLGNNGVFQAISPKTFNSVPVVEPFQLDDTVLATWIGDKELKAMSNEKNEDCDLVFKSELTAKMDAVKKFDIDSLIDRDAMKEVISACKSVAWSEDSKTIIKACSGKWPQLAQAITQHGVAVSELPFRLNNLLSFARAGEKSLDRMMLGGLWPHVIDIATHPTACCFAFAHAPQLEPSLTLLELSCPNESMPLSVVTRCTAVDTFWKDEEIEDVNASQKSVFVSSKYIVESDCSTGDSAIICDLSAVIKGYGEEWKVVKFIPFHKQREYALLCNGKGKGRLFLLDLGGKQDVPLFTEKCAKVREIDGITDIAEVYHELDSAKKYKRRNHDSIYALDSVSRVVTLISLSQPEFQQSFSIISNMDGFKVERIFSSAIPDTIFLVLHASRERRLVCAKVKEELIYANCNWEYIDQKEKMTKKDKSSKGGTKRQGKHTKHTQTLSRSDKRNAKMKAAPSEGKETLNPIDEIMSFKEEIGRNLRFNVNLRNSVKGENEVKREDVSSTLSSSAVNGTGSRERAISLSDDALPITSISQSVKSSSSHSSQKRAPSRSSSSSVTMMSSSSILSSMMAFVPSLSLSTNSSTIRNLASSNALEKYSLEQIDESPRISLAITASTSRSFQHFIAVSDFEKVRIVDKNFSVISEITIPYCGSMTWIGWTLLCISEEQGKVYAVDVSGKYSEVISLPRAFSTSFAFIGVASRSLVLARCIGDTISPFFCEINLEHLLEEGVTAAAAIVTATTTQKSMSDKKYFSNNQFLCLNNEMLTLNKLHSKRNGSDSRYEFLSNARHITRDDPFFAHPQVKSGFGYSQLSVNVEPTDNLARDKTQLSVLRSSLNAAVRIPSSSATEGSSQNRDDSFNSRRFSRTAQTLRTALLRKDVVKSSATERRKTMVDLVPVQQLNNTDSFERIPLSKTYAAPLQYPQVLPFPAAKAEKKVRQQRESYFPSFLPFSPYEKRDISGKCSLKDGDTSLNQITLESNGGMDIIAGQREADYERMNNDFIETWGELRKPKRKDKKNVFVIDSLHICDDYSQSEVITTKSRTSKKHAMKVLSLFASAGSECSDSWTIGKVNKTEKLSAEKTKSSLSSKKEKKSKERTKKGERRSSKNVCVNEKWKVVEPSHSDVQRDDTSNQAKKKHRERKESTADSKNKKMSPSLISLSGSSATPVEQKKEKGKDGKSSRKAVLSGTFVSESKSVQSLKEASKDVPSPDYSQKDSSDKVPASSERSNKTKHLSIYEKRTVELQLTKSEADPTQDDVPVSDSNCKDGTLGDVSIKSESSPSNKPVDSSTESSSHGAVCGMQKVPRDIDAVASDGSTVSKNEALSERSANVESVNGSGDEESTESDGAESDDDSESDDTESDEECVPTSDAPMSKSDSEPIALEAKSLGVSPRLKSPPSLQRIHRKQFTRHHTLMNMTMSSDEFPPRLTKARQGELTKAFGSSSRKLRNLTLMWSEETDPLYVSGAFSVPFADDDVSSDSDAEADPDASTAALQMVTVQNEGPLFDAWDEKDYAACDGCCRSILLSTPLDRDVALRCAAYRKACSWLSDTSVPPLLAARRVCDLPLRRVDRLNAFRTAIEMCIDEGEWRMAKRLILFVTPCLPGAEAEYGNGVKEAEAKRAPHKTLFPEVECYNCGKLHSSGDKCCTCASPSYFDYPHKIVTAATTPRFCNFCKACYCADQLSSLQRTERGISCLFCEIGVISE